jgi:ABC-type arginine/histidine transport system permease subunit
MMNVGRQLLVAVAGSVPKALQPQFGVAYPQSVAYLLRGIAAVVALFVMYYGFRLTAERKE